MDEIGTYEVMQAFEGKLKQVCILHTFGASFSGIEIVVEIRDYADHPEGRFLVSVRRVDDGRETRSKPANTLREAARLIAWHHLE